MLLGGDEFGRTQHGNNNAWCQDNEISWLDWEHELWQRELLDFTRRLIALRHAHPVLPADALLHRPAARGRACRTSGGSAPTAGA